MTTWFKSSYARGILVSLGALILVMIVVAAWQQSPLIGTAVGAVFVATLLLAKRTVRENDTLRNLLLDQTIAPATLAAAVIVVINVAPQLATVSPNVRETIGGLITTYAWLGIIQVLLRMYASWALKKGRTSHSDRKEED